MGRFGKYSSTSTVSALLNSMIGATMLTLPIQFSQSGIFTSTLILIIIGFVCFKTSRIFILHLAPSDRDPRDTIKRIMGVRWEQAFQLISGYYLILLCCVYVVLINDQSFDLIRLIMDRSGNQDLVQTDPTEGMVFDRVSMQYVSLFYFLPLLALISLSNQDEIVKVVKYGVISIFIYFIFLTYHLIDVLVGEGVDLGELTYFTLDFGEVAGAAAVAFAVHTGLGPIIRRNLVTNNNQRDLLASFIIGFVFYLFIGVVGAVVIAGKKDPLCQGTIVNCFKDDWSAAVVELAYVFGTITVLPCFFAISRKRVLDYHFPQKAESKFFAFNVCFMIVATAFSFFSAYVSMQELISIVGSVVGFCLIYAIPSRLHIFCLYYQQHGNVAMSENDVITDYSYGKTKSGHTYSSELSQFQNVCPHSKVKSTMFERALRMSFYLFINLIGLGFAVNALYLAFKPLIDL